MTFTMENMRCIMRSLAEHFGPDCEVVLHDFTQGYEHSVVAIENGHVTGRKVGSSITTSGLESLTGHPEELGDGLYNYFSTSSDGRVIRSSTAILRGEDGEIIGSVCINQDISQYCLAEQVLHNLTRLDVTPEMKEVFVENVDELLDYYLLQCVQLIGRAPSAMNKEELSRAFEFLDGKGVFRVKKAGERICEAFGITKYQLYHTLDIIRAKDGADCG